MFVIDLFKVITKCLGLGVAIHKIDCGFTAQSFYDWWICLSNPFLNYKVDFSFLLDVFNPLNVCNMCLCSTCKCAWLCFCLLCHCTLAWVVGKGLKSNRSGFNRRWNCQLYILKLDIFMFREVRHSACSSQQLSAGELCVWFMLCLMCTYW